MDRGAKRDWMIRFAALAVFVLGFVAGALALNVYHTERGANASSHERFDSIIDRLDLNAGQRDQVKAIFEDAHSQMNS